MPTTHEDAGSVRSRIIFGLSVALIALFELPYRIGLLELGADGSIQMGGAAQSGFMLCRLSAAGVLDISFATQGCFVADFGRIGDRVRVVQQPGGGLLIVSDASQGSQFSLRFTRLNLAGMRDPAYGPNGERILDGLPAGFAMVSGNSVVAEPDGGVTVLATATSGADDYLLARLTAIGSSDASFGADGRLSPRRFIHS